MKALTIAGNIGKDAETRRTQGGDAVTGFSVAVEERRGQDKRTLWFDVSIWGKRGEGLCQYLTKGSKVTVSGDMSTREHEGKTYLTLKASEITLQGGREAQGGGSGGGSQGSQSGGYGGGQSGASGGGYGADMDDDIPFAAQVL